MPLTPQQQQHFWNWLNNQGVPIQCPFCQAQNNNEHQNLAIGEFIETPIHPAGQGNVRMLQVICNHCAYVSLFSVHAVYGIAP